MQGLPEPSAHARFCPQAAETGLPEPCSLKIQNGIWGADIPLPPYYCHYSQPQPSQVGDRNRGLSL